MKRTSIEKTILNIAPVSLCVEKFYLTDELDLWTIRMTLYDGQATPYKGEMELIFDRESGDTHTNQTRFTLKKATDNFSVKHMAEKENEFFIACEVAIKYIKASYIETE